MPVLPPNPGADPRDLQVQTRKNSNIFAIFMHFAKNVGWDGTIFSKKKLAVAGFVDYNVIYSCVKWFLNVPRRGGTTKKPLDAAILRR